VSLRRRRWQAPGGGLVPTDELLDRAQATISLGTRELCCRVGIESKSFRRAAAHLKHAAQLSIAASTLAQVVEAEGKASLAASESGALAPSWQASDCKTQSPDGKAVTRMYVSTDAFTTPQITDAEKRARRKKVLAKRAARPKDKPKLPPLPRRKKGTDQRYKEMKLVQFHDETLEHRLISVTRKDCRGAERILRRDGRRIGFEKADERIGNVDGGPWIAALFLRWTIVLSVLCLDFYHLSEQLNKARRATFGEHSPAGDAWAADLLHIVKHQGYDPFFQRLVEWRGGMRGGKRKAADQLLNYVAVRKEMIVYEQCLPKGWRISSSTTESQCGAVPARIKGSGKRWDGDNAEALLSLEALHQSNLWNQYWTTCAPHNN
jgi:hypothetical protein